MNSFCQYGSDCEDCGPRAPWTFSPTVQSTSALPCDVLDIETCQALPRCAVTVGNGGKGFEAYYGCQDADFCFFVLGTKKQQKHQCAWKKGCTWKGHCYTKGPRGLSDCQETIAFAKNKVFSYGCQSPYFCNYYQGTRAQRKEQCTSPACKWKANKCIYNGKILPSTAPTVDPFLCNEGCFGTRDGICEDGGPGSANALCAFGSDCADCGVRF